jgi:hypothetical protein
MALVNVSGPEAANRPPGQMCECDDARAEGSAVGRFFAGNKLRATVCEKGLYDARPKRDHMTGAKRDSPWAQIGDIRSQLRGAVLQVNPVTYDNEKFHE